MHVGVLLIQSASLIHLVCPSVAVPLCRPLLPCPNRWHGSLSRVMVCDGWLVSYTALPCPGSSGLCSSCEKVHVFLVLLDSQILTSQPSCRGREPCHRLGQCKSGRQRCTATDQMDDGHCGSGRHRHAWIRMQDPTNSATHGTRWYLVTCSIEL